MEASGAAAVKALDAGETWDVLARQVEAFLQAWESRADAPDVAEFLPAGPEHLRRLVLYELIKVDLDYRWSRDQTKRNVDGYLADYHDLAPEGPPCDLLYEEYHVRKRAGDPVEVTDYLRRYPGRAEELARLLGLEAPHLSTALCAGAAPEAVEVGQTLDDFDLLALLGKGAFARVFLARQRSMGRLVALKVSADAGVEPQTLAQFDHPHIVRVYDQRLLPDKGVRLLYMQYVSGGTLQAAADLARRTPSAERNGRLLLRAVDRAAEERGEAPPVESGLRERLAGWSWSATVCWLGARLAEALDYAHRQGVLHRDVKPANVLLTAEGAPKLADFNVSFSTKLEGANPAAYFGGSLAYMSPEQLEAFNPAHPRDPSELDGRSDLYSLCVILWELLAGQRPMPHDDLNGGWDKLLARMTEQRRAGVNRADAPLPVGLPPGLEDVLLAGLDPDLARRPASGAALARELELCLRPRAHHLLRPAQGGWRAFVRRHGLLALLLTPVAPNALASVFNIAYNRSEIIAQVPGAEPIFWKVQFAINSVAYPTCIAAVALLAWRTTRAARLANGGPCDDPIARRRCLILGDGAALVSVSGWLLAAPAFPIGVCMGLGPQPATFILKFMVSLALCGLIAAVYPFFGVTFLAVRVLLPALLRHHALDARELAGIERLKRRTGLYLLLAAVAPMLTVAAWAAMGSENRAALGMLAAVGLIGFGAAFALSRAILTDLDALTGTADGSSSR